MINRKYGPILIIVCVFVVFYLLPLATRPLLDPDESRYAEISREMISSGDWIVPRLDGFRYFEKPIMGYWLNSLSMLIFGMNNFGIRFAAAFSTGITALMVYFLAKKEFSQNTGLVSALIYLLTVGVYFIGTTAVLDSMLTMALTVAFTLFYYAFYAANMKRRSFFLVLFGLAIGFAFLIKGFLVFAVIGSACGSFLIWEFSKNNLKKMKSRPPVMTITQAILQFFIILIPMLLIILPWSIEIGLKEPDFRRFFIIEEHIQRFMGKKAQHAKPFFFYLPVLLAGLLPWSLLLPFTIDRWRTFKLEVPLIRYCICWFLIPFIFFSISKGKLPTYILPIFPPVIILFTYGIQQYLTAPAWTNDYLKWLTRLFIAALAVVLTSVVILQITGLPGLKDINGHSLSLYSMRTEWWKFIIVILTATAWIITLVKSLKNHDLKTKLKWFCVGPALLFICSQVIIPDICIQAKAPCSFLVSCKKMINDNTVIVAEHRIARAVCWNFKRNNVYLLFGANEFGYGLNYDDASRQRMLYSESKSRESISREGIFRESILSFIAKNKGRIVIFMTQKNYKKDVIKNHLLPEPRNIISSRNFVLMEF